MTTKLARWLWVTAMVASCGGGGSGGAPVTQRPPDPTPTRSPWVIEVSKVTYSSKASLAGSMTVTVVLSNTGTAKNPSIELQFNDLSDYADIEGCTPECTTSDGFAGVEAVLPGIAPGKETTYKVTFVPTKIGVAHWDVCIYDDESLGNQVYCGTGSTTVR